jgi:2-dehydropantoate 2-reductase
VQVVVLGAGSLGSLYGAWSADAGHDVCLVARPSHVDAVRAAGLEVRELDGRTRRVAVTAVEDASEAPDADVVLLASKAQDGPALLDAYSGSPTAAWSVQNGARQAEPLVERFGAAAIGCSSMVGATLVGPGVVAHTFHGATYLGALPTSSPAGVDAVVRSFGGAGSHVEIVVRRDIDSVLWSKAVLATGAMGVSVMLRLPYHHVFVEPGARAAFHAIVSDAAQVAAAAGIALVDLPGPLQAGSLVAMPRDEALGRLESVGRAMVEAGQTSVRVSMLQSLETGRRLEVGAVFGDLVELADEHGLDVPVLRLVSSVVATLDEVMQRPGGPSGPTPGRRTEPGGPT